MQTSLKHKLAASAVSAYLHFTGITKRIFWQYNDKVKELEKNGQNYIFALWHSQQAFLVYAFRHTKACALVSLSTDGEYMAQMLKNFGIKSVRGSTSKGASNAVLKLLDSANQGYHPVLTPDGPRGPRKTIQQGILFLAQKTGLPVVPVSCGLKNKIVFNSWDKFEFPLPFGKAAIVYGNPIKVPPDGDLNQKSAEIKAELDRISTLADKLIS
jgi:lysophospholipid acyltransferase (LPLAT)-like uncharacterized protein